MAHIERQEVSVRDLPTRAVTLFPTRAQVVRDLKDILLKQGLNQVSILGLTPTTDPNSIKVEGTGSALITDISVELLPNHELFDDLHPVPDDDQDEDGGNDEDEEGDESLDASSDSATTLALSSEINDTQQKISALCSDLKSAKEVVSNADCRLKMLECFSAKIEPKSGADLGEIVSAYRDQRSIIFDDYMMGSRLQCELEKQLTALRESAAKLDKKLLQEKSKANKSLRKAQKAKRKQAELEAKRRQQKREQQRRQRSEQKRFWPRQCYTVMVTIDNSEYTPVSTRRSSVASAIDLVKPVPEQVDSPMQTNLEPSHPSTCDLSISYVTSAAFWSPCYDVQLNTTSNAATVLFDAQLTNTTSETWKSCKIVLSTSQADFSGLSGSIPKLVPWRIQLGGKNAARGADDIAYSVEERAARQEARYVNTVAGNGPWERAKLFGVPAEMNVPKTTSPKYAFEQAQPPAISQAPQTASAPNAFHDAQRNASAPAPRATGSGGLFGNPGPAAATQTIQTNSFPSPFGSQNASNQSKPTFQSHGLFGVHPQATSTPPPPPPQVKASPSLFGGLGAPKESNDADDDKSVLEFPESEMEETGLTTTYDMPGTKTLVPSFTPSKQRVARLSLAKVDFSRVVIAKLRPAAFLRAKIHNSSKLSLLKGPAGLTLDGAFLGRSSIPQCWSGDSFSLSLGVDPSIRVLYPKADVKRSTSGVFNKEDSTIYTRCITLISTRDDANGKPIHLTVLDQVPVSEDEKIKVAVLNPRGLVKGGAEVSTGVQSGGQGKDGKDWGRAVASVEEDGQIRWEVVLKAGKGARLTLDYEVSLPTGEQVVQSTNHTWSLNKDKATW